MAAGFIWYLSFIAGIIAAALASAVSLFFLLVFRKDNGLDH
jgi:F0F1-type ATP synthase assembly protein I